MSGCERRSCRPALVAGGSGTGVLSARGMTAWMTAVGELAPPASRATGTVDVASRLSSAGREAPGGGKTVSLPGVDQVVAVLTQMVLPLAA